MRNDKPTLIKLKQFCNETAIPLKTVYNALANRQPPFSELFFRIGGRLYAHRDDVDAWLLALRRHRPTEAAGIPPRQRKTPSGTP